MGPGQERGHQVPIQPWIHVVRFALLVVAALVTALVAAVALILLALLAVVAPALLLAVVTVVAALGRALLGCSEDAQRAKRQRSEPQQRVPPWRACRHRPGQI